MATTSDSVRETHKSKRINHRHHWMHAVELLFPSMAAAVRIKVPLPMPGRVLNCSTI
jgi:hypothetical protein